MPTSASSSAPILSSSSPSLPEAAAAAAATATANQSRHVPEEVIGCLNSTAASFEIKFKTLRDLKNQIIGNRTKKLAYLKLGAVPSVVSALTSAAKTATARLGCGAAAGGGDDLLLDSIIVQAAAAIGSFACGFDEGVRAVLQTGALPILFGLITHPNVKVVDAGARSLKLIYHSRLAPKFDFFKEQNMDFIVSLLYNKNENVNALGASVIKHSCRTSAEQNALGYAGVTKKLLKLLEGSVIQRDSSLESLAPVLKDNPEVILKFVGPENGRTMNVVIELLNDKYPRTRLLACMCLIVIRNTVPSYLQDVQIKSKLIRILLELLDDPCQVGDEAPFALSGLILGKEDMQKCAFEENVIETLCNHLEKGSLQAMRLEGIIMALADLCSRLECCRSRLLSLKALQFITDALIHDSDEVRAAACICLRNVSRSVKTLSAGLLMNKTIMSPLIRLLCDASIHIQVGALGAISNIVVDFAVHKSIFIQCGGLKYLVQLSKSMDSTVRLNAVWALRNLLFLVEKTTKEAILLELTQPTLKSLIYDSEAPVQEQALAVVRNLVDGPIDCIDYIFAEDGLLLNAVVRQLQISSKSEVLIQGMYVITNVTSGNELHKEAVMSHLLPTLPEGAESFIVKCLQSTDSRLRIAAAWALVNLSLPNRPGSYSRVVRLKNSDIGSQLKNMINDPCIDVKLRTRTVIGQLMASDHTPF